jgi:hypothetical protein
MKTLLAAGLLFVSFTSLAKEAAKTPDSSRVSKGTPTIEGKASNKSGDPEQTPLPLPLPVRIVEEPPESDDAKCRAAHSSSNEDQDLKAQQSMASSAESQLEATYVVIVLSAFGTLFLIWTVYETRKAAKAAWRSVDIAQQAVTVASEAAEKQLRAYVFPDKDQVLAALRLVVNEQPSGMLAIKNYGLTPAYNLLVVRATAAGPRPIPEDMDLTIPPPAEESRQVLPPGATSYWDFNTTLGGHAITQEEFERFNSGQECFYVFGQIICAEPSDITMPIKMNAKPPKPDRTPIPLDDALRRILSAPPQPRKAKPKKKPKGAGK